MLHEEKISLLDDVVKYVSKKTYGFKDSPYLLKKILLKRSIIKTLENCVNVEYNSLSLDSERYKCLSEDQENELFNKIKTH